MSKLFEVSSKKSIINHLASSPSEPKSDAIDSPSIDEEALNPDQLLAKTPEELENLVRHLSLGDLKERFSNDPWLYNYLLNIWENTQGRTVLTSYPWNMTLAITSTCNAKCTFCSVPMRRSRNPALEEDIDSIPHLKLLLSYVRILILTGGEPTIHPRFGQTLRRLKEILDPRAYVSIITNGNRLHEFKTELLEVNMNYAISLNAATAATHHKLMGLGEDAFPKIIEFIRWARSNGRIVDLSLVVVKDNLHEIPDFLRLAEDLDVHGVYLRTLIPGDYYAAMFPNPEDFKSLPAWSHPDVVMWQERARKTIEEVNIEVYGDPGQWNVPLQSAELPSHIDRETLVASIQNDPPIISTKGEPLPITSTKDSWRRPVPNPYGRMAPFLCSYPWYATKILDPSMLLHPCSFMKQVVGYEDIGLHGADDFFDLWNSPAMVHVRETLRHGPLLPECITCPYQMGGKGQCQSDHQASD